MPLSAGSRLGHYDVTDLLGEGGMGQVWRNRYQDDSCVCDWERQCTSISTLPALSALLWSRLFFWAR